MALTAMDYTMLALAANLSQNMIENIKPDLEKIDHWYNSGGGAKARLTQTDFDDAAATAKLSGLSKAQLDSGINSLSAVFKANVTSEYPNLALLAERT